MKRFWLPLAVIALVGCVEDTPEPADDDKADTGSSGENDGGNVGSDGSEVDPVDLGLPPPDVRVPDASEPPPPPPRDGEGCAAYCGRLDDCLLPACPPLSNTRQMCANACRNQRDGALAELAQLSCDEFTDRLFDGSEELARFCDDSMPPPEGCDRVCDLAAECGSDQGRDQCLATCRAVGDDTRQCMINAENCQQLGRCFQPRPMPPNDRERCQAFCNRQTQCVFLECAAGTLPDDFNDGCREECIDDPPSQENMQWVFDQLCPDVVSGVRERNPGIDERCENDEEEVCALLCENTIRPCSDEFDPEGCEADCAGFDEANLVCLQTADNCGDVNACFGDPAGQDRCERWCEHLQTCLEEACPPRVIPPPLSVNCTAGCLDEPPEEMEVLDWEMQACREVRQFVYQRNRQLRPICEGGRDFRPTADECAAFCDNSLQACIGVGGRHFCLAACASLTRDQYGCALAAQGDCIEIGGCLEPPEDD